MFDAQYCVVTTFTGWIDKAWDFFKIDKYLEKLSFQFQCGKVEEGPLKFYFKVQILSKTFASSDVKICYS